MNYNQAVAKINQKIEDPEFKKKMSDFKEKVSHTTKEFGVNTNSQTFLSFFNRKKRANLPKKATVALKM